MSISMDYPLRNDKRVAYLLICGVLACFVYIALTDELVSYGLFYTAVFIPAAMGLTAEIRRSESLNNDIVLLTTATVGTLYLILSISDNANQFFYTLPYREINIVFDIDLMNLCT